MQVIRSKHAGVCYGVERALDLASAALMDEAKTYTLGPLIHNPKVVGQLEEQGIFSINDVDDVSDGVIVLRSHGVHPRVVARIKEKGLSYIDATCPHVAKAQKAAARLADECGTVLVIGQSQHPEVKGLCGYAHDEAIVIAGADEIPEELLEPVGVLVQTTESKEKLDAVVEALMARGIEPVVKNTICFATRQRQESAANLASSVDAMIIVGGKNSSNTTHLYDICRQECDRCFFVEGLEEIQAQWFEDCSTVGVTAGASTPEDQITPVVDYLKSL